MCRPSSKGIRKNGLMRIASVPPKKKVSIIAFTRTVPRYKIGMDISIMTIQPLHNYLFPSLPSQMIRFYGPIIHRTVI